MTTLYESAGCVLELMLRAGIHYPLSDSEQHKETQRISESLALYAAYRRGGGQRVLDIGLGTGVMACAARQACRCEVFAIEQPTRWWVHDAQWRQWVLRDNEIRLVVTDIVENPLPFWDGTFDAAWLCEVVEHLPVYPKALLSEVHRILKAGGQLLLTTPNFGCLHNVEKFIRGQEVTLYGWDVVYPDDPKYHPHVHEFTLGELRRLLAIAGFEIKAARHSLWPVETAKGVRQQIHRAIWHFLPHLRPGLMLLARRVQPRDSESNAVDEPSNGNL